MNFFTLSPQRIRDYFLKFVSSNKAIFSILAFCTMGLYQQITCQKRQNLRKKIILIQMHVFAA